MGRLRAGRLRGCVGALVKVSRVWTKVVVVRLQGVTVRDAKK